MCQVNDSRWVLCGQSGLLNAQDKAKKQTQWHLEVLLCIIPRVGGGFSGKGH